MLTLSTEQIERKGAAGKEEAAWTWSEAAKEDLLRPEEPYIAAA